MAEPENETPDAALKDGKDKMKGTTEIFQDVVTL